MNYQIQNNKFHEVKMLISFVNCAKVISRKQAEFFLKNLGLNEHKSDSVIKIAVGKNLVSPSNSGGFLLSNDVAYSDNYISYFGRIDKVNWLYADLVGYLNAINYDCKFPCKAFMYNTENEKSITVFSVRSDLLGDDCNAIETNFATINTKSCPVLTVLLIENVDDIDRIILSDSFNILAFVLVKYDKNANGIIKYYDKNKNEIEVKK